MHTFGWLRWVASSCVASITWQGGLSEWPTLTPPHPHTPALVPRLPHTAWYMSDHCICLKYFLFLPLISVCIDFDEIKNLFWISFAENLPNNCFRFSFSPTKSLATSARAGASVLSLCTCNIMRWFSLESPVVERNYEKRSFTSGIGHWHDVSVSLGHSFTHDKLFPTSFRRLKQDLNRKLKILSTCWRNSLIKWHERRVLFSRPCGDILSTHMERTSVLG